MKKLPLAADPYEAARRAFFVLNSGGTDEDWSRWVAKHTSGTERGFDDFAALANICRKAAESLSKTEGELHQWFAFARGYFQAMELVISAAWLAQPSSGCIQKHMNRNRLKLVGADSEFKK